MRRQILENIREVLGNKLLDKDYIFINRGIPTDAEELPVINLNSVSEEVTNHNQAPKSYKRTFNFSLEIIVSGNDFAQVHNRLEDMIDNVEFGIESAAVLNSIHIETNLSRIEYEYDSGGESPIGSAIMSYNSEREVDAAFDSECFKTLNSVHIDWKIKDNTEENEVDAIDEIINLND